MAAFTGGAVTSRWASATPEPQSPYLPFDQMSRVLLLVEHNYVEPAQREKLLDGALRGDEQGGRGVGDLAGDTGGEAAAGLHDPLRCLVGSEVGGHDRQGLVEPGDESVDDGREFESAVEHDARQRRERARRVRGEGGEQRVHAGPALGGVRGEAALDEGARRIVELGAPYAPFPDELRRRYDTLVIVRDWQFRQGAQFR